MSYNYGRIFIPQDYGLEYCKSPQAIVFDEFVRIYFSYCVPDGKKLISRTGFVDFDKKFKKIRKVSKDVMPDGVLGAFDEHGIFPFSPFLDGTQIKAITSGWTRRQSVSTDAALGLAVSNDAGETFKRYGDGPVMAATVNEPYLVADGFVVKSDEYGYLMYYIFGTDWADYDEADQPERTYKIAIAQSDNLLDWKRDGKQIIESRFPGEAQALPTVIYWKGCWHMAFCYRHTVGFRNDSSHAYRIGYASSLDMWNWKRDDSKIKIPLEDWCNEMQCYPNLFKMDGNLYFLYNGNHFAQNGFGLMKLEGF